MKKRIVAILVGVLCVSTLMGCGDAATASSGSVVSGSSEEVDILTDADFVENLGKGLEARWELTDSEEYNDDALKELPLAELQKAYTLFVNAELEAIGNLQDYEFEDEELKKIAETYIKGLELQKEGTQYQGTTDYENQERTWQLGYNYRAVCMNDLYVNYGLAVDEKYQANLDDFVAASATAKRNIAIQDFVNELSETLVYTKDEEKSDGYSTFYKAVIENTTDFEIGGLEIDVDFLDASGVVIYQTTDYLENIKAGSKIQSELYCGMNVSDFETMQFNITAYNY